MTLNTVKTPLASIVLTFSILLATYLVTQRYLVPVLWACVIVIASWPLYQRWLQLCRNHHTWAASSFSVFILLLTLLPLIWLTLTLSQEAQTATRFLITHNQQGIPTPTWLHYIPFMGHKVMAFWNDNLARPQFIQHIGRFFRQNYRVILPFIQVFSTKALHHSVNTLFSFLTLFFLYKDGHKLSPQIERLGQNILTERWEHYFSDLADAIRGVVNGTVFTGLSVGFIMTVCYVFTPLPFPALFGVATAFLAMIPFGIALILIGVAAILLLQGSYAACISIVIIGSLINFISDHIIKPKLISRAVQLPFLLILVGIIGGIETLGLIGLFLGPMIMVLCYKLFLEFSAPTPK